jgi:hypothetical protein
MMALLHRFFWEDSRTRGATYAFTAITGIIYALVRNLAFQKPERQVSLELIAFLFVSNFTLILLYCLRGGKIGSQPAPVFTYRLPLSLRLGGVAACLVLLTAPQLSVSTVQAAIVNQRLERAASSVEPDKVPHLSNNQLQARFQKITSIANTSIEYKIPARPDLVEKVRSNLEETLRSVNPNHEEPRKSGVAAFIALVAYARANNVLISISGPILLFSHGETGNMMVSQVPIKNATGWWQGSAQGSAIFAIPETLGAVFPISHSSVVFNAINFKAFGFGRGFVETDNESQVVIMNATVDGATQKLDAIVWLNIKFKNSKIIYSGEPLYLGDVTFENCLFQFGSDAESQKVLTQIKAAGNQPVTVLSGEQ